jgi:transposase
MEKRSACPSDVTDEGEQGRTQAHQLARQAQSATGRTVKLACADPGYTGQHAAQVARDEGLEWPFIRSSGAKRGVALLPRRRAVERSFGEGNRFAGSRATASACPNPSPDYMSLSSSRDGTTRAVSYLRTRTHIL